MIQTDAAILWNRKIGPAYFHMGLDCPNGFENAVPGQFITLRTSQQQTPLLRRPFSIHRLIEENNQILGVEILYRMAGACTRYLSTLPPGEKVNILGPLGKGFTIPDSDCIIYMAAGGIGVAPMVFLVERLQSAMKQVSGWMMFLGGRTPADLLCEKAFRQLGMRLHLATDDGGIGHKGLVTDLLQKAIKKTRPDIIFACGPMPMLKTIVKIAQTHQIPCQVSIETLMACGMGVCLGCALDDEGVTDRYRHVCIDGPVFDAATLGFI